MAFERKPLVEQAQATQQRSRELRKQTEITFAATQRLFERARQLAKSIKTKMPKNARAVKKAS
ncbi:MAG: hypothetical protein JWO20_601 [Candidatus Angelobacter sp.]|jgi:hypothetical protein|nr:hypothetical protein [Candidatus Angelobacter sp.]